MYHKYIAPLTLIEWIRLADKSRTNCSVVWKVVVKHFDLVGSGLVWRIGNGRRVRLGIDPWVGCGRDRVLPEEMRLHLVTRGCLFITDIEDQENSSLWHQGWISAQRLDIHDDLQEAWEGFIRQLRVTNVRLTNRDDKLVWDYHPSGCYTPKHGYIQLNVLAHNR